MKKADLRPQGDQKLTTPWGEALDERRVLMEYPRPQMRRDSYLNLNGRWEYAVTEDDDIPENWDGIILVPFSPESALSGVEIGRAHV